MGSFKYLIFSFLFLIFTSIHAQEETIIDSTTRKNEINPDSFVIRTQEIHQWLNQWVDTGLTLYHRTGFAGSVYQLQYLPDKIKEMPSTFNSLFQTFSHYSIQDTTLSFLPPAGWQPYSVASYTQGAKREQQFSFWMYFPWGKQMKVLLNYHLIGSAGAYKNQKTSLANFFSKINFSSKNNRFQSLWLIQDNYFRFQENGGIKYVDDFIDTSLYDRALCPVQLIKSSRHQRRTYFLWDNSFLFFQKSSWTLRFSPALLEFEKKYSRYRDEFPGSGYYPQILLDSSVTLDSISITTYRLSSRIKLDIKNFNLVLSARQEWNEFSSMFSLDTVSTRMDLHWKWLSRNKKWGWTGKAHKGVAGADRKEFNFQHMLSSSLLHYGQLFFSQEMHYYHPPFLYEHFKGNHLQYHFILPEVFILLHQIGFRSRPVTVEFYFADVIDLPIYYQENFFNSGYHRWRGINLLFQVDYRNFFTRARLILQQPVLSWFHLPTMGLYGENFYRTWFFKRKLLTEFGLKYFYSTSFLADAYHPYLGVFYPQWDLKTGGFWYPSFFIRAQVKRAIIFAELYNFTAGMLPVRYWQVPGYPLPDRGVRWGISWMFLN